ncbi:hypothetical protein CHCC20375_0324 [Bacillus licheniformis]|nr:hypothetical protein CHCC20375_0324 [Bacillus licheniformis]
MIKYGYASSAYPFYFGKMETIGSAEEEKGRIQKEAWDVRSNLREK